MQLILYTLMLKVKILLSKYVINFEITYQSYKYSINCTIYGNVKIMI